MKSHAKASSAGSSARQAKGLGGIVLGGFATHGASGDVAGSGAPSRRLPILLVALVSAVIVAAFGAAGAGATTFHPFLETFGSAAQPSFSFPGGIAIHQATGDVYVMDSSVPRTIKRYNADGTPDNFSALGSNAIDGKEGADATPQNGLSFASPSESQIAIDNSGTATDGNVYVTQSSPNLVNIFSPTGAYLGQLTAAGATNFTEACGVAADSSGAVYVGDYTSGIHKFVPAANPPVNADHTATFTTTSQPCTLAAGSGATAGFLFPAQYNGPISKIDGSTGELKYSFSSGVTTVSVNPANGHVYALKGSGLTEFDASGTGGASTLASDALASQGRAIAVRGSSGNAYVGSSATNLEVFGALTTVPTVAVQAASGITATEATLNGTVNPEGVALTECNFEWGPASGSGYPNSAPCEQAVPTDSSVHVVSADIGGLSAEGSRYRFRLVAKNVNGAETSDPETFSVGAHIDGTAATVGTEEAILRGSIDPNGLATTYKFEWGETNAYGNSTEPVGNISAGDEPVAVEEELDGLTSGQTYHYRLVAINATGATTGPDQTFTVTASTPLPQRGYEIASQYPTGGLPMVEKTGLQVASEDGNSLAVSALNPLLNSTLAPLGERGLAQYVFTRGSDSWQHRAETGAGSQSWSGDLGALLLVTFSGPPGSGNTFEDSRIDPDDQNGTRDVYRWQANGGLTWISRDPRIPAGTSQVANGTADTADNIGSFTMSADSRALVFKSERQLLDADTTLNVGSVGNWPFRLYKWKDGQLSFIGKRPDGSVPAQGSWLGGFEEAAPRYAVSRDGSRVIFGALRQDGVGGAGFGNTGSTGAGIYLQTDGQPTVEATKEEGVPALPAPQPYNVTYRGAAADDSRVFFTSASRFTPDSGGGATSTGATDLYVYDVAADELRDLTPRLDGLEDPSVDPATADRARVLGVAANSEDGKRVYFVAEGAYPTPPNPEGELPQASSPNLYMAELDSIDEPVTLRFIATLGAQDNANWQQRWPNKTALASQDGSVLGFASLESLTGQPLGGTRQLFVYDATQGTLHCPSCPSDGTLPVASVNRHDEVLEEPVYEWQGEGGVKRWMSSEGTVFFTTYTALLPADENTANDVYEYRDGELGLISPGKGPTDSLFSAASVDGSTVFFNTTQALVPQDKEPGIQKIYAARVGGGFPYVPPEAPCDFNAGACEGPTTEVPQTPGAGTAAFEGPGNPKPSAKRRCPKGKRKVRHRGKVRCVKKRHGRAAHHHKRNAKHDGRASR